MTAFKQLKLKIKKQQKEKAASIRILKAARKPHVYNSNPGLYDKLGDLERLQYDYRHIHISYCMFFNKTKYEDIERSYHEGPNSHYLTTNKREWNDILEDAKDEEIVCDRS